MNPQQTAAPSAKKSSWMIIGIIIIVAALAVAYWQMTREKTVEVAPNQTVTTASAGKAVSSFPDELLQEQDAAIKQSFALSYGDTGISQPVVQYVSKQGLEDNVVIYRQYLGNNGWMVTHEANPAENPTFFYATKEDGSQLNITFVEQSGQVSVTVAYANKVQ